ncbi:hypothetical protein J6590_085236 [Homalodisca vitripennis]|nr:hypothetical protein J6590_085236 [Homalodisca vitripennis]
MCHRKCFRDAAHNATPPPLPPITTHSRSRAQLKSSNCTLDYHTQRSVGACALESSSRLPPHEIPCRTCSYSAIA